jgi:hypothetical protein
MSPADKARDLLSIKCTGLWSQQGHITELPF